MTVEKDPCPLCGKNRKMVGYSHRCEPPPQFTPGLEEARVAIEAAAEQHKEAPALLATKPTKAQKKRSAGAETRRRARAISPAVAAVAAQIEEKRAAKASREGKRSFTVWINADLAHRVKIAAAKHKTTQEVIVAEGIALMLAGEYKV